MIWNQIKTAFFLACLSGILLLLGSVIGGKSGLQIALVIALVMNFITYFFSDKIVLALYHAKPLDPHQYARIYSIVKELSSSMKLPMPKLWLINSPVANAFATGRNPSHASVALTTGILSILDESELRGVLAHELSHVYNRDILISTIAATIATAIGYLASMAKFAAFWGTPSNNNNDRQKGSNALTMLLVAILMPIAATIVQLAISRSREYLADENGARVSREPLALASALNKLQNNVSRAHFDRNDMTKTSTASLFIVNPFLGNGLLALFSTHPPAAKRIEILQNMAKSKL